MVDGCLKWRRNGLNVPKIVSDTTNDYLVEQNIMQQFIDDIRLQRSERGFQSTASLFERWRAWCGERGHESGSETAFSTELAEHGFERKATKSARGFKVNLGA
jgi:putative DNA primase/helicase